MNPLWVATQKLIKGNQPLLELETAEHGFEVLRIDSIEITVGGFYFADVRFCLVYFSIHRNTFENKSLTPSILTAC